MTTLEQKSTTEEIRARFDRDVERFSRLDTGQETAMDAPVMLQLLRDLGRAWLRPGARLLDLGCGAGNFTLALAQEVNPLDCTLADLSAPMLERARERVSAVNRGAVATVQGDMRDLALPQNHFDLIVTGAALHHLRDAADWRRMFTRLAGWLRPGGILYVSDFISCDDPAVQEVMWARYGRYLESTGGPALREKVFAYVDREDSPRSLAFQFETLCACGFAFTEVLHRNAVFAAYYARKA
ncbi:MAG TPA: class I SAM-dependent methyltransferase [Opitutales bacterium]|nr:class I SAM-dependent methyltransferase [Opitutales bacterium]